MGLFLNHKSTEMKNLLLIVLISATVSTTSCHWIDGERIRGNGTIKTQVVNEKGFRHIDVSGAMKVYVKQDSLESVKVVTDENLLEYVEVYVSKTTLIIKEKEGYNLKPSDGVKIYVSGPEFRHLEASGASSFYSENKLTGSEEVYIDLTGASHASLDVNAPKVSFDLTGASELDVKGQTKDLRIEASGASHIKCFDLQSENASVNLSGAGSAEVFASVKLDADVSGAAHVRYKGNPAVSQDVSGAGSVKKTDAP